MLACVWLIGFGMLCLPLFGVWGKIYRLELTKLERETESAKFCDIQDDDNGGNPKETFFIFAFFFPCASIITCYCAIFYKIRKTRQQLTGYFEFLKSSEKDEEFKQMKTMLIIFLCFLITFTPVGLLNMIDPDVKHYDIHVLFHILWWSSPVINPFIYVYKNKHYIRAIRLLKNRILGVLFCETDSTAGNNSNQFSLPQHQRVQSGPITSRLQQENANRNRRTTCNF